MDSVILNHLVDIVAALVQALLLGLIAYGFAKVMPKIQDDRVWKALGILQGAINDTVGVLNQTLVEKWKEANLGKLTPEQIRQLEQISIEKVKSNLTQPVLELLDASYANLNEKINDMIKARLDEIKSKSIKAEPLLEVKQEQTDCEKDI